MSVGAAHQSSAPVPLSDILMPQEEVEVEGEVYVLQRTAKQHLDGLRQRAETLRGILSELERRPDEQS